MEEAVQDLQAQNIAVVFTGLHGQPEIMLKRFNLVPGLVNEEYIFEDFQDCMPWLNAHIKANDFFGNSSTVTEKPAEL